MIAGIFHKGSGLGDQLFRYITTRVLALDKGYEWGMLYPNDFKGKEFMDLELPERFKQMPFKWEEKKMLEEGVDIRSYDPEINFVQDNTVIDGSFEDERYWGHRLHDIRQWLKVEPIDMPDNVCIINFRGGEYSLFPELFLTKDYWKQAIDLMKSKYPQITFSIHTDDMVLAEEFFKDLLSSGYMVTQNMVLNWRSIRYAKHLILSNSAFAILPALLNEDVKEVIAPRYWARRNTKIWARPANYYKKFTYL